jgi:glycosyltransferase involved in cell wall biosynthesis
MEVGFIHAGAPEHGVSRYGRLLASAAAQTADVRVRECEVRLDGRSDQEQLLAAAEQLAAADLVHVQYNSQPKGSVWGPGWRQFRNLRLFGAAVRRPLVVTVHDVYSLKPAWPSALRRPGREVRRLAANGPQLAVRYWLQRRAARLLVCSEEERRHLSRSRVVPHFVEARPLQGSRDEIRRALALADRRVVTLLGYIHERKGHRLLIEALKQLPDDVVAVFAGAPAPSSNGIVEDLRALADSLGVATRLRITGYLPEQQLEQYLMATDVAVCPFRSLSASGSLSTWISTARPIVATALPQIAEYNAVAPGAIATFHPRSPEALARAVRTVLQDGGEAQSDALRRVRERLLLPAIAGRHVTIYREVANGN